MQDTCFERAAQHRADADDRLAAGDTARRAQPEDTHADETGTDHTSTDHTSTDQTSAIAQGIAETLSELGTDNPDAFDVGAVPLDGPQAPPQILSSGGSPPPRRRRRRSRSDASSRLILMAMLVSALLALGMVGFAVTEGFIP